MSGSPYPTTVSGAVDADYSISDAAGALTVTPAPLTITADDKSKVYGAALPTLTASYSGFVNGDTAASLTTRPTLSTTAAVGSQVSGSPYIITASGAVDPDYTISYAAGALTVTPTPLTITADDKSKVYGAALPALTASYSGFVNGDTAASLATAPTLSTTATAGSHVSGSPYPITASSAVDADYTISYVAASLTVTAVPLTITADDKSKAYGAALPALTDRYSGFVNGDSASSLTTAPTLSTTATPASHVSGSPYAITASSAVDADYTISYVAGALTVTAAPLTITADDKSKVYGAALPALTASYSGFVNGDAAASLTTPPSLSTTATASSHVSGSPYAITASGPGQLTVTSGTVTGTQGGKFVFNADGSFTYTPPANFPGFDYAKYTATDTAGDTGTATVNVLSQTGGVVWKFYESVLHRDPDYGGLQFWINDVASGGKTGDIAVGFFESTELLAQIITAYYEQYLGRAADSDGLNYYINQWRTNGGSEQSEAAFFASPEFHTLAQTDYGGHGAYPVDWLWGLYERILDRPPSASDLTFWEQQLSGGTSEYHVALDFFISREAHNNDVAAWYDEYLGRAPTASEQAQYADQMNIGANDRTIEQEITNLPEYGANPPASPPGTGVRLPDYYPQTAAAKSHDSIAATDAVFAKLA